MKTRPLRMLVFFFVLFCALAMRMQTSVNAALRPYAFLGTVTGKDLESGSIRIHTDYHLPSGFRGDTWTVHRELIEENAPLDAVGGLRFGDYVEVTSLGAR